MHLNPPIFWNCAGSQESHFIECGEAKWSGIAVPRGGRAPSISRRSLKDKQQYMNLWVGTTVLTTLMKDDVICACFILGDWAMRMLVYGRRLCYENKRFLSLFKKHNENKNPSRPRFHGLEMRIKSIFSLMTASHYLERSLGFVLFCFVYNILLYFIMWSWWIIFWWVYCSGCLDMNTIVYIYCINVLLWIWMLL